MQAGVHAVRFYENSEALAGIAAGFIAEGLAAGHPALVVATSDHCRRILDAARTTIDIERFTRGGDLTVVDAHDALAAITVEGMPDAKRFEENVLPIVDKAAAGQKGRVMRVYGEMVDVLWKQRREAAALRLEALGNRLIHMRKVSILCGYSLQSSYNAGSFDAICREHNHVVTIDGRAVEIGAGGVI